MEKTVAAHRACLREHAAEPFADPTAHPGAAKSATQPSPEPTQSRLPSRTRDRYAAVRSLVDKGYSINAAARELGLDPHTVRRFTHASNLQELLAKTTSRGILLDAFTAHLHRRWGDGVTDAAALYREIRADGYRGSEQTVRRYLRPFRAGATAPPSVPDPPKVRHLSG